jgi:hypothetical protein
MFKCPSRHRRGPIGSSGTNWPPRPVSLRIRPTRNGAHGCRQGVPTMPTCSPWPSGSATSSTPASSVRRLRLPPHERRNDIFMERRVRRARASQRPLPLRPWLLLGRRASPRQPPRPVRAISAEIESPTPSWPNCPSLSRPSTLLLSSRFSAAKTRMAGTSPAILTAGCHAPAVTSGFSRLAPFPGRGRAPSDQ